MVWACQALHTYTSSCGQIHVLPVPNVDLVTMFALICVFCNWWRTSGITEHFYKDIDNIGADDMGPSINIETNQWSPALHAVYSYTKYIFI